MRPDKSKEASNARAGKRRPGPLLAACLVAAPIIIGLIAAACIAMYGA